VSTILVVDDDLGLRRLTEMIIRRAHPDAVIVVADNGSNAWKIINAPGRKFDLVVSDLQMPEMDGIELSRKIRESCPDTRIILLSGMERPPENHPAHAFVAKPFPAENLLEVIERLMHK